MARLHGPSPVLFTIVLVVVSATSSTVGGTLDRPSATSVGWGGLVSYGSTPTLNISWSVGPLCQRNAPYADVCYGTSGAVYVPPIGGFVMIGQHFSGYGLPLTNNSLVLSGTDATVRANFPLPCTPYFPLYSGSGDTLFMDCTRSPGPHLVLNILGVNASSGQIENTFTPPQSNAYVYVTYPVAIDLASQILFAGEDPGFGILVFSLATNSLLMNFTDAPNHRVAPLVFDPVSNALIVADETRNRVVALNPLTGSLEATLPEPTNLNISGYAQFANHLGVVDRANQRLYLAVDPGGSLAVLNASTYQVLPPIPLGLDSPVAWLILDPVHGDLYAGSEAGQVVVVNLSSEAPLASLGRAGYDAAYDPADDTLLSDSGPGVTVYLGHLHHGISRQLTGFLGVSPALGVVAVGIATGVLLGVCSALWRRPPSLPGERIPPG